MRRLFIFIAFIFYSWVCPAQYFGENKVQYEDYPFTVAKTKHFSIYHYLEDSTVVNDFAARSELWYKQHQQVLKDTLRNNPIILYKNHADFQQTSVIRGLIGGGTGGVTEGLRNRVVIPLTHTHHETQHVLGHEMVHAFQYQMLKSADSINLEQVGNVPLWMIEGLAEYLSIGRTDNRTAMWMRDAVKHDDLPTLKDLSRRPMDYFPYRYGHAFWAYVAGRYGEDIIRPYFMNTVRHGYKQATDSTLYISADTLSARWARALKHHYKPWLQATQPPAGEPLLSKKEGGTMMLSPTVSPDGKYMVLISNRDAISINYYMADLEKGKIIKKLSAPLRKSHIDNFNFIESGGSWAPDSKKFAISIVSKGQNMLKTIDVSGRKPRSSKAIKLGKLEAFSSPAWAPGGNSIVVSGLENGKSNLFLYDLEEDSLTQLTHTNASAIQPAWSPDGKKIAFVTDKPATAEEETAYQIAVYHTATGQVEHPAILPRADKFSPRFSETGRSLYFLAHADGFRNLYRYDFPTDSLFRLTRFQTGISGITDLSPAYSISHKEGELFYTYYQDDDYQVYRTPLSSLEAEPVPLDFNDARAATLPPRMMQQPEPKYKGMLAQDTPQTRTRDLPYQKRFSLEYLGTSGVGFGASQFGTAMAGGVTALFGDMLGNHQLYTIARVNGEVYDIGGQAAYLNRENRITWGASLGHIPYRSSYMLYKPQDTVELDDQQFVMQNLIQIDQRIFNDQAGLFAQYPFSRHVRIEAGASISRYSFRFDSTNHYYDLAGIQRFEDKNKIDAPPPFWLYSASAAWVGDHVDYGVTSPLRGWRYRFDAGYTLGKYDYAQVIADYRQYFFFKPLGLAFRTMHHGRYGADPSLLYPYFLGQNYFIRGYTYNSLSNTSCMESSECLSMNQIQGNKLALFNIEARFPFSGPEELSLIRSRYIYTDLFAFFDGGLAWENPESIAMEWQPTGEGHLPVFSTGIGVRLNLMGYFVLEPYVAIPFQNPNADFSYGLGITGSGW